MRSNMAMRWGLLLFVVEAACDDARASSVDEVQTVVASSQPLMAATLGTRALQRSLPLWIQVSLTTAAERLVDLQADQLGDNAHNGLLDSDPDDGGWDWTDPADATGHSDVSSPDNLYGEIALGPLVAVRAGARSPRLRTSLIDAGFGMQSNPAIDSAPDFVYLTLLAELFDNPGFSELARARYDALIASSSGAQTLAEKTRADRAAAGQAGLIPYDLAWHMLGAAALDRVFSNAGYDVDADTFAAAANADLPAGTPGFDPTDPSEAFYTHGLAWSLVALSHDPAQKARLASTRAQLLARQHADGAWDWNADYPADNTQATAFATTGLMLAADSDLRSWVAAARGALWLVRHQSPAGGWTNADAIENPQVDADAMLAIYLVASGPSADQLGLRSGATESLVIAPTGSRASPPPTAAPNGH